MSGITRFKAGDLEREIALRGKTLGEFAEKASIDAGTLTKACRGESVRPKTFGKIVAALGRIPVLQGAERFLERTA